ncbi:hypothetical protein HER32_16765 [Hymenobacter sp. BT18]|uniref:McrC family protein n=1 Tax=Hymenobacter sp. BT18 TaxID=2835648 RepID=UPI00143E4B2C|nr:hypothetical protein [Hymenobacter sp. BT18]QIX62735.1 hypothetical protein HER32_16765 [Hymenobacter sp. BT18]
MDFYLYEYRTRLPLATLAEYGISASDLQAHLQQLWVNRPRVPFWRAPNDDGSTKQRFLRFHGEDGTISARNYVGQIQINGHTLHLLPKVFWPGSAPATTEPSELSLQAMHAHLFWWLRYSHKLRFPRALASFEAVPTSLYEVLILLFAQYTHELLSRAHYQYYQEVSEDLNTLRGQVNFTAYARYFGTGRGHYLPCTYDSFQPDNRFNRILRYVTSQLLNRTTQDHTRHLLQEIHFQLDEVADQTATLADCDQVQLSPLFDDFRVVLDYCRLFLADNGPLASHTPDVRVFAILLPTEVLFEDFIEGFVRTHLATQFQVRSQTRDLYLAEVTPNDTKKPQKLFQLRHDLLLRAKPSKKHQDYPIVVDTKYKLLPIDSGSIEASSVAQADMYQLVSYALRRGTPYTHLFYPDSLRHPASDPLDNRLDYSVKSKLAGAETFITISAHRLPIVLTAAFSENYSASGFGEILPDHEQALQARLLSALSTVS